MELGRNQFTNKHSKFLRVYRWPAYAFICLAFVAEFTSCLVRALGFQSGIFVTGVVYTLISMLLTGCYLYAGIVLIKRLIKSAKHRGHSKIREKQKSLSKVVGLVLAAGFCLCCLIVVAALISSPVYEIHVAFNTLNYLLFILTTVVALMHALSFNPGLKQGK